MKLEIVKLTIFSCIVSICAPVPTISQIVNDVQIYKNGSIPDLALDQKGNINIVYSSLYSGVKYFVLDPMLHSISDTILIEHTESASLPSISINSEFAALVWRDIRLGPPQDFIEGTIIKTNFEFAVDSLLYFNDDFISDCNRWNPDVCFLNDTSFIVVWFGYSPIQVEYMSIYGQLCSTSGRLLGSNFFLNEHDQYNVNSKSPIVRSFPSNDGFVVVWIDDYAGDNTIYGRLFFPDGAPKDSSFSISNKNMSNIFYIAMDMDIYGNYVVVWSAEVNSQWNIYWRWFNHAGFPLSNIICITDSTDKVSPYSDLDCSISSSGKIVVVWEKDESNYSRIYAKRFDSSKNAVGKSFLVSTNPRNSYQVSPRVILNNDTIYTFWGEAESVWANVIDFKNPPNSIVRTSYKMPVHFKLYQNYPNPFNNTTLIRFFLTKADNVSFNIYDVSGKKIISLLNSEYTPGLHKVYWNSTDLSGNKVVSGLYFGELITSYGYETIKILLLR